MSELEEQERVERQRMAAARKLESSVDMGACLLSLVAIGLGIGGATSWGWGLAAAGSVLLTVTLLSRIDFRGPPKGTQNEPA